MTANKSRAQVKTGRAAVGAQRVASTPTNSEWLIPISDGSDPIRITIRHERVVPPCVFVDLRMPTRLLTTLEACHVSLALGEASKVAGQMRAKQEGRKR